MSHSLFTILVVDDEIELANLFKQFLSQMGYKAVAFTDPSLALEYLKFNGKKIDLVLTDLRMPEISGIDLAIEINKNNPKIKIMLITAFMTEDLEFDPKFKNARLESVIQKPVRFPVLKSLIENSLNMPVSPRDNIF